MEMTVTGGFVPIMIFCTIYVTLSLFVELLNFIVNGRD